MKTPEEIKKALEMCARSDVLCTECPYEPDNDYNAVDYFDDVLSCSDGMESDALEYIKQLEENQTKRGKWDENDYCTVCDRKPITDGFEISTMYNYCPYCGARMGRNDE